MTTLLQGYVTGEPHFNWSITTYHLPPPNFHPYYPLLTLLITHATGEPPSRWSYLFKEATNVAFMVKCVPWLPTVHPFSITPTLPCHPPPHLLTPSS